MFKVKIKCGPGNVPARDDLLSIVSKFKVKCCTLQNLNNSAFLLWCNSDDDVDILFSSECVKALESVSCFPQLPPNVKAMRTIILRHLDDVVCKKDEDELVHEIQEKNSWLIITDLFLSKINNS